MLLPTILTITLLFSPLVAGDQRPLRTATRTTFVDALSKDPDSFSTLLGLLQRARLIPTLNRLKNATFFAPTNEAIERYNNSGQRPPWLDALGHDPTTNVDNVHYELRQHLFYHLLNYSLSMPSLDSHVPTILDTLLFPDVPSAPPTDEPPPGPPWIPVPGGLLNGDPQKLRIISRKSHVQVGVNAFGDGGARVVKPPITVSNGVLIPIGDVLHLPGNSYEEMSKHPLLSEFVSILTEPLIETLRTAPHVTLFLPADSGWDGLDSIERRYLHSGYAEKDVTRLLAMHASGSGVNASGVVGWSDKWNDNSTCRHLDVDRNCTRTD